MTRIIRIIRIPIRIIRIATFFTVGQKKTKQIEVEAVKVETVKTAEPVVSEGAKAETVQKVAKEKPSFSHKGKGYQTAVKLIDKKKDYSFDDAIKTIRATNLAKFDAAVDSHLNLGIDPKEQRVRTTLTLPHPFRAEKKVLVFSAEKVVGADITGTDEAISKIADGSLKPKRDFDEVIAEPTFMPKLAKIAKILGPAGMMPNPKKGTISTDIAKLLSEIKKGKFEIKSELNAPIIHTSLGKLSFSDAQLKENFEEIIKAIKEVRPQKVKGDYLTSTYLTSSMSPSVKLLPQK